MYKISEKIENISALCECENSILYYKKNGDLFVNDKKINVSNKIIGGSFLDTKRVIVYTATGQLVYDFTESKIIYSKDNYFGFCFKVDEFFIATKSVSDTIGSMTVNNWILFDYINNQEIESFNWDKNYGYPIYFDKNTIKIIFRGSAQSNKIICFVGRNEQFSWQYETYDIGFYRDLSTNSREDYEIRNIIGVVSGILWIDIKPAILLGLDIETGEAKHILKMPSPKSPLFEENGYAALYGYNKTVYDAVTNKLIGVNWWHYYEVDLSKSEPTLDLRFLKEECLVHKTVVSYPDRRCMDATHIYFADAADTTIAALNRATFKIDWVYRFTGSEAERIGTLMTIEVTNDKLYVLDHIGNLFIFEKNEV